MAFREEDSRLLCRIVSYMAELSSLTDKLCSLVSVKLSAMLQLVQCVLILSDNRVVQSSHSSATFCHFGSKRHKSELEK